MLRHLIRCCFRIALTNQGTFRNRMRNLNIHFGKKDIQYI
jgi:hypothetical protein